MSISARNEKNVQKAYFMHKLRAKKKYINAHKATSFSFDALYNVFIKKNNVWRTAMIECDSNVKSITSGRSLTVYIEGDIDHHNARAVRSRIDTKIYIQRPDELIIDLSRVSFMDSSGLGLILGRYTKATELGIVFKVANPTPQIKRILDLAGTERLIKIENKEHTRQSVR